MEAIIWLVIMVIFLIAEAVTVTTVSLWFAGGSLAALIAALLGAKIWMQIVIFLAVSAALLACLRPLVRKHFTPRIKATNVDAVVGTRGYVTADIDNIAATGTVRLGGMEWTARSAAGDPIPAGALVQVVRIEGVKAIVTPAEVTANT
ncbi:MAG: NfeD family protein [Oscillospiraceae bacterium]|nr:NfeD family protein [Oscillospiraceae bacterium]